MSYTYKQLKHPLTNKIDTKTILRKEDKVYIPCNEENKDYRKYLEWAKTNTIEAAD